MDIKIRLFVFLLFLFTGSSIKAQDAKNKFLGLETGFNLAYPDNQLSTLKGLNADKVLNPQIRIQGGYELYSGWYLKGAFGLSSHSTKMVYEQFEDKISMGVSPNFSIGAEKELVTFGKFSGFLGLDVMVSFRSKMASYQINSSEGVVLLPANSSESIMIKEGLVKYGSSRSILNLLPHLGVKYQINNKVQATVQTSYGWNVSESLAILDYKNITLNTKDYQFKSTYSGNFIGFSLGLRYRL
jgi:hypothetical protein